MNPDSIDRSSLFRRDKIKITFEDVIGKCGPIAKWSVRVTCMVFWIIGALLVQFICLLLLNAVFHEYVDPRPEYAESANNIGGWSLVSIPVVGQLLLGWCLRDVLTRSWLVCVAGCQIILSAYYIL